MPRRKKRRPLRRAAFWAAAVVAIAGVGLAARVLGGDARGTVARDLASPPAGVRVRVEILNGGGVAGHARMATDVAREAGFDVVFFGNAESFGRTESEVVDRVGRPELARAVAAALGIDVVRTEEDPNRYVDVSVVLGSGWRDPSAAQDPEGRP